jgi:hypothetical protein
MLLIHQINNIRVEINSIWWINNIYRNPIGCQFMLLMHLIHSIHVGCDDVLIQQSLLVYITLE